MKFRIAFDLPCRDNPVREYSKPDFVEGRRKAYRMEHTLRLYLEQQEHIPYFLYVFCEATGAWVDEFAFQKQLILSLRLYGLLNSSLMQQKEACQIREEDNPFEKATEVVEKWWNACCHLPDAEFREHLALQLSVLFRDRTIPTEYKAHFSITCLEQGPAEYRLYGDAQALLKALARALQYEEIRQLVYAAIAVNASSSNFSNNE